MVVIAVLAVSSDYKAQAQSQNVRFANIDDAVGGRFFDPATTAPDPANPNKLIIKFNTGIIPGTFTFATFTASTEAFYSPYAMDTIRFDVGAPAGFYISKITYSQTGSGSIARTGRAAGWATWVVDGDAVSIGEFRTNPTKTSTVDLTGRNKTRLSVSITNGLFTFSTPQLGSATIAMASADVVVELLPLP